jgi:hypothetical protein
MWNLGDTPFVVGANLPWIGYGTDFGASAWHPEGGLSARHAALNRLERTLAFLKDDGIPIVRVFVLCDGRSGIQYNSSGRPTSLDHACLSDLDALMAAARRYDVRVMPALFDFHLCSPLQLLDGVQIGGRTQLIIDPDGRSALLENVLTPILRRYGDDDIVAAWDVFNEPEWCLDMLPASRPPGLPDRSSPVEETERRLAFDALQGFLHLTVQCVRAFARQPVTVGSAGLWQLDLVRPLGLDFYQVHWYERFGWPALERPVQDLGLDRPAILGEFSGRATRWAIAEVLEAAQRAGYRGALVWSVLAEDDQSEYSPEIIAWIRAHADGVNST